MDAPIEVVKGLRFRKLVADEKVLFEVQELIGKKYWTCVAMNEIYMIDGTEYDGDYAGHEIACSEKEILSALHVDSLFGGYDPANYEPQRRVWS